MPYESAHDLPSFVEISQGLKSIKLLKFFLPKAERGKIKELEAQLRLLGDTVDKFYAVLGPRHWIFHDNLPVEEIADLLTASSGPAEAERRLIDYYKTPETLDSLTLRLRGHTAMRKRAHLVTRARDDYLAGRYYACIHVLLSVMDGFVNEFESARRGLHAREAEELDAFDSVVGHHMGLAKAHEAFRRRKGATSSEPVYELYRNGIVHGTLLNYDNEVVATKAWNMLLAVADWARARAKEQQPSRVEPTWRELFAQLAENAKQQRANDAWKPQTLVPSDPTFNAHPAYAACEELLSYWTKRNYGKIATLLSKTVQDAYAPTMPRQVRNEYGGYNLSSYQVLRIEEIASEVCVVDVKLAFESGEEKTASLRWIYEDDDGQAQPSSLRGVWHLMVWGPAAFLADTPGQGATELL